MLPKNRQCVVPRVQWRTLDVQSGVTCRVSVLTLKACVQSPDHGIAEEMLSSVYNQRRMPQFLSNAAPDAEVHSGFLDILDSFQQDQDGQEPLAETVKELTGKPLLPLWLHL